MDLSFHKVKSVNNGICKDEYLDDKLDLGFPKVDEYVEFSKSIRKYCLVFKKDLRQTNMYLSFRIYPTHQFRFIL